MDPRELAAAERADLARFLATLRPQEWDHPSLCQGWAVRDVVAHLVQVDDLGPPKVAARFLRVRFDVDRFNAHGVAERREWPPARLLETLNAQTRLGRLSRIRNGVPALLDAVVHHQDIRRPLGRPREIPHDRLRVALDATGLLERANLSAGLRLVATDLDWTSGEGPEVHGPGEAILMTLAGRRAAVEDLRGDGLPALAERLG